MMTTKKAGLSGFICEVTDQPVSFQECLDCAANGAPGCNMVAPVIHAAVNSIRDPNYANLLAKQEDAEIGFSVTEILNCPRQTRLKQEYSYCEKPSAMYRMNRGSGYHDLLSQYPNGIREKTLKWRFGYKGKTVLLVGTPDLIEATPKGWLVTDYKVTGNAPYGRKVTLCAVCEGDTYKGDEGLTCVNCGPIRSKADILKIFRPPQARSSHVWQVNLYALLVEKNAAALGGTAKFAGAQVVYFPDRAPLRIPVELDRDATMDFLRKQLTALLADDLPPILEDPDELWRCDYCPVRSQCEALYGGPVGKAALQEAQEALEATA